MPSLYPEDLGKEEANFAAMRAGMKYFIFIITILALFSGTAFSQEKERLERLIIEKARSSKYEEAILLCDRHIGDYPKDYWGYNAKAIQYNSLYDYEKAELWYRKALDVCNRHPEVKNNRMWKIVMLENLGSLNRSLGKYEEAIAYYKKCILEDPEMREKYLLQISKTHILLKNRDLARKQFDNAAPGIQRVLEKESVYDRGNIYRLAAFIAYQLRDKDLAIGFAEKYNLFKDNDKSKLFLAKIYHSFEELPKSRNVFGVIDLENLNNIERAEYFAILHSTMDCIAYLKAEMMRLPVKGRTALKKEIQREWFVDVWKNMRELDEFQKLMN